MTKYKLKLSSISENSNIFSNEFNISLSKYYAEPLLKLGFHHYLHQSKSKLKIFNNDKYKNKDFYHVVNNFNSKINDYEEDIHNTTLKYFKFNPKNKLKSFYKIWEIIYLLNLVSNNKALNILNVSQSNNESIQAVILYRNKFNNNFSKKDNYCSVVNELNNNTIKCFNKEKFLEVENKNKLDNIEDINKLLKNLEKYKEKADLIIYDNNFNFKNKLYEEQESFKSLIATFILALNAQNKNGSLICKIYEVFTTVTIKLICIIKHFYKNVYIYKPYTSDPSDTELFLICKDFIPSNNFKNDINKLEKMFDSISNNSSKNKQIFDIVTNFEISENLFQKILNMNLVISSLQFNKINKLITYIENKEYFGEDYHNYREKQINASKFWINHFYSKTENDIISKRKDLLENN